MLRTALRALRAHARRFLMSAVAVVLGVAFLTGSLLYGRSVESALTRTASRSEVSVEVRTAFSARAGSPGAGARLDARLVRRLGTLPGVAAVRGTAEGRVLLVGSDGTLVGSPSQAVGVNFVPGPSGRDPRYPLIAGRSPRTSGEIAIDRRAADRAGYRVGDRARVVVNGTVRPARVVGVLTTRDGPAAAGGTLTAFDTATAQRQFAPTPHSYTAISLTAAEGTSQTRLAQEVTGLLPTGLEAVTKAELDSEAGPSDAAKISRLLMAFACLVLFVSTFLVANTFTMLSAARSREHALLRAIGAGRTYVTRLVLTEAVLVGALASAVGYPLGIGVARLLASVFDATGGTPGPVPVLAGGPLLTAFGVGVGISALSAYLPARRAAAVAPVAALRTGEPPTASSLRRRNATGLGVTAVGVALTLAAISAQDLFAVAVPVVLVGLVILTPLFADAPARLLRSPLTRLAGIRGTLAVENARRNPRRTAATASALTIGLALVAATTVAISSLSRQAERQADTAMTSDLRVTAVDFARVGDDTAARVARLPDAAAVSPTVDAPMRLADGDLFQATAVDPATVARLAPLTLRQGSLAGLDHGIAVTGQAAAAHGWRLGSRITATFVPGSSPTTLPVVAVYDGPDELTPALVSAASLPHPVAAADRPLITSVLVAAVAGRTAALEGEIRRALDNPALVVQDRAEARQEAARPYTPFLNVMYAMLSVAVLIGALGVANTMTMAVFERVREIGLLRAIGFDRRQVGTVLRLESVGISLLGAALGLTAGSLIGIAAVVSQDGAPLVMPWGRLALFFALAAVIGTLAALWPAWQAARIPVLEALRSDTE